MATMTEPKFSFISSVLGDDTFAVVNFNGFSEISHPYEFHVTLEANSGTLDLSAPIKAAARFIFHLETGGEISYHGIVAKFEQLHEVDQHFYYRAVLVPKLWWLQLTYHNQIFLDKTLPEIIEAVLKDAGLTSMDYELKLQKSYSKLPYVCQLEESHFNFISRWMEREGLYYYFEQTSGGEKMIITDSSLSHTPAPMGANLIYSPPSMLATTHRNELVQAITCQKKLISNQTFLKDYYDQTPSLPVTGTAPVDAEGVGQVYFYGDRFNTTAQGNDLAKIRSEELLARKEEYVGESTAPSIDSGFCFTLQDHYRSNYNQEYLVLSKNFQGHQTGFVFSGMGGSSAQDEQVYYLCHFTAIPSSVQFRAERRQKKRRYFGFIPAQIDAAASGQYAELDEQGRYKVIMPFDLSGRKDGKASIWIRMMQPYAGKDHGFHLPLHKGTEVMVAFVDGDPDRPFIAGAMPNPETPSPLFDQNQTAAGFVTSGQTSFTIQDRQDHEYLFIRSGDTVSHLTMGATAAQIPPMPIEEMEEQSEENYKNCQITMQTHTAAAKNEIGSSYCDGQHRVGVIGNRELLIMGTDDTAKLSADTYQFAMDTLDSQSENISKRDASHNGSTIPIFYLVHPVVFMSTDLRLNELTRKLMENLEKVGLSDHGDVVPVLSLDKIVFAVVNENGQTAVVKQANHEAVSGSSVEPENMYLGTEKGSVFSYAAEDISSVAKQILQTAFEKVEIIAPDRIQIYNTKEEKYVGKTGVGSEKVFVQGLKGISIVTDPDVTPKDLLGFDCEGIMIWVRKKSDINVKCDNNIKIEAKKKIDMKADKDVSIASAMEGVVMMAQKDIKMISKSQKAIVNAAQKILIG